MIISRLLFVLAISFGFSAHATICDDAIAKDYSGAITEIARGLVQLEAMKTTGSADSPSGISISRELKKQRERLSAILGAETFEAALQKALARESKIVKAEKEATVNRKKAAVEKEDDALAVWYEDFMTPKTKRTAPSVAFSSDSKLMVIPNINGDGEIWSLEDGKKLVELIPTAKVEHQSLHPFKISPDNSYILGAAFTGDVCAWDVKTGKELYCLPHPDCGDGVDYIEFTPDGKFFVTASRVGSSRAGRVVRVWNAETRKVHYRIPQDEVLEGLSLSPNGRYMLMMSKKYISGKKDVSAVRVVDILNKTRLGKIANGIDDPIIGQAEFTPDGKHILISEKEGGIELWSFGGDETNPFNWALGKVGYQQASLVKNIRSSEQSEGESFSFTPDGKFMLITGEAFKTVGLFSTATWEAIREPKLADATYLDAIVSPSSREAVVTQLDGHTLIMSVNGGDFSQTLETENTMPRAQYSPDGRYLILSDRGSAIYVFKRLKSTVTE